MKFIIAITFCFFVFSSIGQITIPGWSLSPKTYTKIGFASTITKADTVQVVCGIIPYYDTSYTQRTTCELVNGKITHDSTYQSCSKFLWWTTCKTKTTKVTHDTTYQSCKQYFDTVITTTSIPKYCDSIIYTPIDPTPKPRMKGLVTRQFNWVQTKWIDTSFIRSVPNAVDRFYLADVNPKEGVYDFTCIDTVLAWVDKVKLLYGIDYHIKIRIINKFPLWMKVKFGSFAVPTCGYDSTGWNDGDSISVKWWNPAFLDAYEKLMDTLSKRYDNDGRIQDVVISATSFGTAEPFNLAISNSGCGLLRKNAYTAAGLTDSLRLAAIYRSIDLMQVWKRTNLSIALNPFEHLPPRMPTEIQTSMEVGDYMCAMYGTRSILGNNGLRPAAVDPDWQSPNGKMWQLETFYNTMSAKYGGGVYNQSGSTKQLMGTPPIYDEMTAIDLTCQSGLVYGIWYLEHPDTQSVFIKEFTMPNIQKYGLLYLR